MGSANTVAFHRNGTVVRVQRIVHRSRASHSTGERSPHLNFNPSRFTNRLTVLFLASIGFAVACYLALYQSGIFHTVWDPFFGAQNSERVLHSPISRWLPIPDAWLGAFGYVADFVTCGIGDSQRWRTAPRFVLVYGVVVAAVALAALTLAMLQPLVVHAGCTLCLTSAAISLAIAWLARHEVIAAVNHLYEKRKAK
jgi:uncharacterized membrane protein